MRSYVEFALFVAAVATVILIVSEFFRSRLRVRREAEMVASLAGDVPEEPTTIDMGRLDRRLRAAGLPGPSEAYLFTASLIAAAVSFVLLGLLPALPVVAALGLALTLYAEWTAVAALARRRARRFEQQLVDAIDLMAGTLQAGGNLTQSLRSAGDASPQPLRGEFGEAFRRLALGMSIRRALAQMVESYDCEGVRLFSQTLTAKLEAGGELAPVLRALNETLRDRLRQQRQVRAQLAGARLTAVAVVILPYLLAPILQWMQPGWFTMLFASSFGTSLLFIAVMLQIIGLLWLWHILEKEF